jgi:hypothetical protein
MNRITIYSADEYGEPKRLGWFDLDATEHILEEASRWDGQNRRGVISGMQINRAQLYRTSGGRWVENQDHSPEFNGPDRWRFLTDDDARQWMIQSGDKDAEEALQKWFPETPDESGPDSKGGRPSVGPTINVAYPRDLLDKIEAAADKAGMSRAAWLRKIAEDAVA